MEAALDLGQGEAFGLWKPDKQSGQDEVAAGKKEKHSKIVQRFLKSKQINTLVIQYKLIEDYRWNFVQIWEVETS